jgi:hypothetical protein
MTALPIVVALLRTTSILDVIAIWNAYSVVIFMEERGYVSSGQNLFQLT